jgi:hypothetical protein
MGAGRRKKEDDFLSFQEDRKLRKLVLSACCIAFCLLICKQNKSISYGTLSFPS